MMEFLIEYGPAQLYWEPVEVFLKLSCVQLLLQLISIACNWKTYYARWDQREVSKIGSLLMLMLVFTWCMLNKYLLNWIGTLWTWIWETRLSVIIKHDKYLCKCTECLVLMIIYTAPQIRIMYSCESVMQSMWLQLAEVLKLSWDWSLVFFVLRL